MFEDHLQVYEQFIDLRIDRQNIKGHDEPEIIGDKVLLIRFLNYNHLVR